MISSAYRWVIGLAYVAVVCITIIVCSVFVESGAYERLLKAMLRGLFRVLAIPVRVRGASRLASGGSGRGAGIGAGKGASRGAVSDAVEDRRLAAEGGGGQGRLILCNHVSLFDVPLLGGFLPVAIRGVEWQSHFRWPLYGLAIRRLGNIPIDRDDAFASMRSFQRVRRMLRAGQSLVIMPEGHRTLDGKLRPFKRLPFHLARQAGVELVPVGISGLFGLHPKGSRLIRSSRLLVKIGAPIPVSTVKASTAAELRDLARRRIAQLIERP